jgi:hypothetical protein
VSYLRRSYHAVDGLWFVMVEGELAQVPQFSAKIAV